MTRVRAAEPGGLRVILCLKFARQAGFSKVAECKRVLIADERVLHSVDVSGSFDFMVEAEHTELASYQKMLDDLGVRFGDLIEYIEASFICRRYLREEERDSPHLWVPAPSGLQRLEHAQIDKVTAEGDYVRVHSNAASWLLHTTMGKTFEQLGSEHFLQFSRSLIVRADFVDRLTHHNRRWAALLNDGSRQRIAQSRSSRVISHLKTKSPVPKASSSMSYAQDESLHDVIENAVQ